MLNFTYHIPTKAFFGEGQIASLVDAVKEYGTRVLVVTYKRRSDSEMKICEEALSRMKDAGITCTLFNQVDPNPVITTVAEGGKLCRKDGIEVVLAIGGGSAIDCAKGIAAAARYDGDPWDLVLHNDWVKSALPVGCILTIAAAGSEMDHTAVISNLVTKEKLHLFNDLLTPSFAILDPTYTYSVPRFQTAAGCADIISHAMEVYFANTPDTYVQNRMAEGMMKTVIHYTDTVLSDPCNYEARANIMWASTLTINSMLAHGKLIQWSTHYIEHTVSAFYNVPHGAGIAVILPHWMEYVLDETTVDNFVDFAVNVWGIPCSDDPFAIARAGITALREYLFKKLELPSTLRELGVEEDKLNELAASAVGEGPIKGTKLLLQEDVYKILRSAF